MTAPLPTAQKVCTRFAPSPTGMLHIGGARTALYCYLYAKHMGGKYLLRIEDTDHKRSTPQAVQVILDGLEWLGIEHDGVEVYQSKLQAQHVAAAQKLLASGHAYKCICTPSELETMRTQQQTQGQKPMYNQKCRTLAQEPTDKPYTVRLKTPTEGHTTWQDDVQGKISYANTELDDFIILRSDGTPTYNLVVVVDDASMGITHVIRGDDHINNTPKQILIYKALGLDVPTFGHIPLIHGPDGKKLSKRHGAVAVTTFREDGFLPEAINNYLMQLGWSYKEDMVDKNTAIKHFDLKDVNKGAANFDTQKLEWFNSQYLMKMDGATLLKALLPYLPTQPSKVQTQRLERGLPSLAKRTKRLTDLATSAQIYLAERPLSPDENAKQTLDAEACKRLDKLQTTLLKMQAWTPEQLDETVKTFTQKHGYKMPEIGKPLRAALVGTTQAPSLGDIMHTLGKDETLARLADIP